MGTQAEITEQLKRQTRRPSGPGDLLGDFLETTKMTQGEAARRLGVGSQSVNDLINDKRGLTPVMANRLAILCGDDGPDIWMRLQLQRDLWDALYMDRAAFTNVVPYDRTP